MVLTLLCVITPAVYLTSNGQGGAAELEEELDLILIFIRYLIPLLRLVLFIRKKSKASNDHNIEKIDFGTLELEAEELGKSRLSMEDDDRGVTLGSPLKNMLTK